MRRFGSLVMAGMLCIVWLSGCSSARTVATGSGGTAQMSLTMRDLPPTNITILSLQVTVQSAILQPGSVSLISGPQTVDLAQLQTDVAFLGTAKVTQGTFTSLALTFTSPQMTFINNTGGPITPAQGTTCPVGGVCQYSPIFPGGGLVTLSTSPFPLTVNTSAPVGLEVDMNLVDLVQADFSLNFFATDGVNVSSLPTAQATTELRRLNHILGSVKTTGTNLFTLLTEAGNTLTINADTSTQFDFSGSGCSANNFTCIAVNQILQVNASLLGNGTLLAKEVDFEDSAGNSVVQGIVVSVGSGTPPTSFQFVVHQEVPSVPGIMIGEEISANIQSGAAFAVDNHLFTLPTGLSFSSSANLLVGQEVLARVVGTVSGTTTPPSFNTNRVALRPAQVMAQVFSINASANSFVLQTLPSLFTSAAPSNILQLTVDTTSQTEFDQLSPASISGVLVGNFVSAGGFLFQTSGNVNSGTVAAFTVRGQPVPGT